MRNAVAAAVVVFRHDLLLDGVVNHLGVKLVLIALIGERAFHGQHPSRALLVAFDPPSVEYRELEHAVHDALLARRARRFERTGRGVEPYVHALHHAAGQLHVVILQEEDLAYELRHGGHFDDAFDEVLTRLVVRVRFAREDELHGTLLVVDDRRQPVEVGEQQVGALVGGEAAGETDGQHVGLDALDDLNHLARRVETHLIGVAVAAADMLYELVLEIHALVPQLFVGNLVDLLPCRDVVGVPLESVGEIAGVQAAHAGRDPRREVHAVGDVPDMKLVFEVARPHAAQNILRHLAVEPRHAVHLLREVAGQHRHRELLVGVVGIGLAQVDILLPGDAQHVGIVRHVLADHRLGECVVACGHGGVRREERRRAHHLQRLGERELAVVHQIADALDADECGVALVAVEHVVLDAQLTQRADAADAQ